MRNIGSLLFLLMEAFYETKLNCHLPARMLDLLKENSQLVNGL